MMSPRASFLAVDQTFVKPRTAADGGLVGQAKSEDRFEDLPPLRPGTIPVNGLCHEAMSAVDDAILKVMAERGIPSLTFALSKEGKILHDRAFGWADANLKTPLQPGVKMRVASMTKPVISAAIHTLISDGKLKADQLVYGILDLGQYRESKSCDERWKQVTVQHLLDHKGGWDRAKSGDFSNEAAKMAAIYKVRLNKLEPMHVVRFGLTVPMDFNPGERSAYSNYGYILLARVIEKVSGQRLMDYLHATVCAKSGIKSFSSSSSDARDRQPGEIWYCYHPEYQRKEVPLPFRVDARDGAGILATTAADYCRFLEAYWVSGEVRAGGRHRGAFSGSHAGVTAVCSQRTDGINYVVIANRRGVGKVDLNADIRAAVDAALASVVNRL